MKLNFLNRFSKVLKI